ncbi:DUF6691 family protein [Leptospira kmetyi]|uniref:YeeE/YedE family protein n=1 Tax=Leptospira kmetyi TaxID=408139 RepID=A0ABX4NE05_9LEPT|nr:DUF6691 family protein [Leptospira kmetyi]EQA55468.1 sulfur transport [Leptospira kmetyi serovar Malaysia str. Bejo-Iso9]PJZ30387.1 hypothetical protein CH378_08140 [Leptospira kmetyi]PJZ41625.1 hypothetical protein CH370_09260 [Leptospira kmetyi]TGK12981.1 YeeE/YedE family protein [Leptospira kmetyi]TGK34741.1 YeeE/YedE family protein [Leptospira kmetyi]
MKYNFGALIVGLLFAIGLGISGILQPSNIVGFLDVFGNWNPTLLFTMAGAVGVHFVTYKLIRKRKTPMFTKEWFIPTRKEITPALVVGSVIFGIGWGLGGYCPTVSITSLASFEARPLIVFASIILGMLLFRFIDQKMNLKNKLE